MKATKWPVFFVYVFFILGCTSQEKRNQLLAKAAEAPRFRIGLVTIQEPKLYQTKVLHYRIPNPTVTLPGRVASFGMISAAKGLDTLALNYNLTQLLKDQDFVISQRLTEQLKNELATVGYEVLDAPLRDHRHASNFRGGFCLNEAPSSEPCANYFLHVVIDFAGYIAPTQAQAFVPLLQLRVQLISVTGENDFPQLSNDQFGVTGTTDTTFKLIYAATFTYGGIVPVTGPTDVLASPEFALRNSDELRNHQRIITGLYEGADKLAKQIAVNLQ